jgi:hypothetical protein
MPRHYRKSEAMNALCRFEDAKSMPLAAQVVHQ